MRTITLEGGPRDGDTREIEDGFVGDLVWTCDENCAFDVGRYVVASTRSRLAYWRLWEKAPPAPEPARTVHVPIEELTLHQLWEEIIRRYPNVALLIQKDRSSTQEEERIWWQGSCAATLGLAQLLADAVMKFREEKGR